MLKSAEQIAREKIALYTAGLWSNGRCIVPGMPIVAAAAQAAAASPQFAKEIAEAAAEGDGLRVNGRD